MAQHQALTLQNNHDLNRWLETISRPLVFTNGCFDILHRGHVAYLQSAANRGASLLVALNSDESVKRLNKGVDRPYNSLQERMAVIAALGCVDAVCSFDQNTPLQLIQLTHPDKLIKGGDWPIDTIVGCREVQSWGGECFSIAFEFERSTTALVNKIRCT